MSGKDGKPDGRPGRRRTLTYDERVVWTTFTKTIVPLSERPPLADDDELEDAPAVPRAPASTRRAASAKRPAEPVSPPAAPPPSPLAPLDRREKRRVASGRNAIDARFDLHGLTQGEAHAELLRFLHSATARGARLVLVITGKSGVLRRQVPLWLALPEFRALAIGYETAHIRHGGEGALYVRLRRAR
jgi:DNA-nicking Smr family endonuclease